MRYAVVGFGTAGYHGVKAIRRYDSAGQIDVYSNTGRAPYNPMLTTYYIYGKLKREGMYPFGELEDMKRELDFSMITEPVVKIHGESRQVETASGKKEYDRILIATGARAFAPPVKGLKPEDCFVMRTDDDAEQLKERLEQKNVKHAAVIGASMAGIKVAEVLNKNGVDTYLLDLAPWIFPLAAYEETAGGIVSRVENRGVHMMFQNTIDHMECGSGGQRAVLTGGSEIPADIVVLCIGTRAATETAAGEVEIGRGIVVNERMETSAPGIYAAGDCCEGRNLESGENQIIGLWANANHQGDVAGANMAGQNVSFGGNILHNITHFMDLDFIGFGDNRISGKVLEYGRAEEGLYIRMVFQDGRIAGANILDNYRISGIIKNYMLRLFAGEKSRIPDYQRGMLVKAGLTEELIKEIEDNIHG
ncbi:MAG: FAD-dependent oxidoreductase [Eubacteriales bacterium]|nr:FAD-dependent oxidoreductase [Eubacteriales bacterium]